MNSHLEKGSSLKDLFLNVYRQLFHVCTHFAIIQETEGRGGGGVRSIVFWLVINNNLPEVHCIYLQDALATAIATLSDHPLFQSTKTLQAFTKSLEHALNHSSMH